MHHHLCNLNPNGIVYPPIKLIRPVLHHHFTLIKVSRMIVRAAYIICISMGQLRFNSIRSVSHFIQACAASGSCCMRAICTTPVKALKKLTQRVRGHRAAWVISSRKEVLPMSCQTMAGSEHFNGLRGKGNKMFSVGFHSRCGNGPQCFIKIEFRPFRFSDFGWSPASTTLNSLIEWMGTGDTDLCTLFELRCSEIT